MTHKNTSYYHSTGKGILPNSKPGQCPPSFQSNPIRQEQPHHTGRYPAPPAYQTYPPVTAPPAQPGYPRPPTPGHPYYPTPPAGRGFCLDCALSWQDVTDWLREFPASAVIHGAHVQGTAGRRGLPSD